MNILVNIVNAFVKNGEGGNPAGVVIDANSLTDSQMQQIAAMIGASETAFILTDANETHRLRFFTPTTEVNLCGHATIASWSLMHNKQLHSSGKYSQATLAGTVGITIDQDGTIFMEQPQQPIDGTVTTKHICEVLKIHDSDLDVSFEPRLVRGNLMVALKNDELLQSLKPDMDRMTSISNEHGFHSFHVFTYIGQQELLAKARDFCPAIGIPEDPATGTANGSLIAYLQHQGRLPQQDTYRIKQGEAIDTPSLILAKINEGKVWVGGTTKIYEPRYITL